MFCSCLGFLFGVGGGIGYLTKKGPGKENKRANSRVKN